MNKNGDKHHSIVRAIQKDRKGLINNLHQLIIRDIYRPSPSIRMVNKKGETIEVWALMDRIVHKLLEQLLFKAFYPRISPCCIHVKRHGGMKKGLSKLKDALQRYPYVYKTDIQACYASISHDLLMKMISEVISCEVVLGLIRAVILAPVRVNGELIQRNGKGIPLTCCLSPLLCAIYLSSIDQLFSEKKDIFYLRYMDDFIILTKNHKRLEEVVAQARAEMNALEVDPHPKKTFVGKTIRGFTFLGFSFQVTERPPKKPGGKPLRHVTQTVRAETMRRCFLRSILIYKNSDSRERIEDYWKNFLSWAQHSVSEADQWMLWTSERRWGYFLTHILPVYSSA